MAGEWVKPIESYMDSSSSPTKQNADIDAIAALLKNHMLTIETLVREMEMYLTATDDFIRARGILLLAELLARISTIPLDDTSMRSLIRFFTGKLADWKALRGALVGCLALIKRENNGMVTINEAKAAAQNFLESVHVQSLGQHDRKLCFELLECLLRRYPDAIVALGDFFVSGICGCIDSEQDPECLLKSFNIIEVLGRLMPDPCGPLAELAGDIFDILGQYFPVHFTHPKGEEVDLKRDELSKALMLAFASTPYFEPFAIPLLLEKLSSSLPSSKVEVLIYLSHCSIDYGADRMSKHYKAIWPLLKNTIFDLLKPVTSLESFVSQDNEIAVEALMLLQKLVAQNSEAFSELIIEDEEIKLTFNSMTTFESYSSISVQNKQKLHALGRIVSISAKASTAACNKVFQSFFCRLMNFLGISVSSGDIGIEEDDKILGKLNYGALHLCIELLNGCRFLILGSEEISLNIDFESEAWYGLLRSFRCSLIDFCFSILRSSGDEDSQVAYICAAVQILENLTTFPGSSLSISKSRYENILTRLMSIIKSNSHNILLWKSSWQLLVKIGLFVGKRDESEKTQGFMTIVVEELSSLISSDDTVLPLSLYLEAIYEIGEIGTNFMLVVAQGLEKAVLSKLSQTLVLGNATSANFAVELLNCLSHKVLPWFGKHGGLNDVSSQLAINIWGVFLKESKLHIGPQKEALLHATMTSMKLVVANCSEEFQSIIVNKAFDVLSSECSILLANTTSSSSTKIEALEFCERDEWIISLFASVVIALRPQTHIPNIETVIRVFMAALLHGYIPAAQALASILNKLSSKSNKVDSFMGFTIEECIEIVFSTNSYCSDDGGLLSICSGTSNNKRAIHVISGLAWIGKGLIMRGHEKIKDVTMSLLSCLLSKGDIGDFSLNTDHLKDRNEKDNTIVMASAADAFQIIMSNSEDCLNKKFHTVIRPLYKQRYFSTMMPILISSVGNPEASITRSMLYRAFAHIISETPLTAIISEAKKLILGILDSISILSEDITNKELVYGMLLVLSGILTDRNGREAAVENTSLIINRLSRLVSYPHMMLVRVTAIQCLVVTSELPHAKIFPMRTQVLRAIILNALDDPKRQIRQEAVRCRQAWLDLLYLDCSPY